MKKLLLLIIVSLVLTGAASASETWTDGDPADSLWSTVGNWNDSIPLIGDWAKIRGTVDNPAYIVDGIDAVAQKIHCGYSEGGAIVMYGGTLTTAETILLGKQGGAGEFHMHGGYVDCKRDLEVSDGGPGLFIMTGGLFDLTRDFDIPDGSTDAEAHMRGGILNVGDDITMGPTGSLNLDRGTINVNDDITMTGGALDITFGTLIIGDNSPTTNVVRLATYIGDGWITGFGIVGNVSVVDDGDDLIVTAIADPLLRNPTMDEWVYHGSTLSWTNLPANVGSDVWVNVYFGKTDDPNSPELVASKQINKVSQSVNTSSTGDGEYIWRVDTFSHGHPDSDIYNYGDDPNVNGVPIDIGMTMYFKAYDDFPPTAVEITSTPQVTAKNVVISLSATVTDDNVSAQTIVWTSDIVGAVFTNKAYTYPTATADVTYATAVGAFDVTVSVSDLSPLVEPDPTDSITLQCLEDACAVARYLNDQNNIPQPSEDIDDDCDFDLDDLALLAADWLVPYAISVPTVIPPAVP